MYPKIWKKFILFNILYQGLSTMRQNLLLRKIFIFIALISALLGGCGVVDLKVRKTLDHPNIHPKTVAILPFTLAGPTPEGVPVHKLFRECFFNYFSYLGYVDIPLETIDAKLQAAGMLKFKKVLELSPERLRDILGVDAVVKGQVLDTSNFTGGIHAETSIQAKIVMLNLRTGETLWETEHTESTYSGILSPTIVEIIQDQIENVKVYQALYKTAEFFSIGMMKEIPDPTGVWQEKIRLPEIISIETNLKPNQKLQTNDQIYVNLKGDPGLKGSFGIGSWKSNIPLKEIIPGMYSGNYIVQEQDEVSSALIIGTLKNSQGLAGKRFYKSGIAQIGKSSDL
jgi:hypothetical protein